MYIYTNTHAKSVCVYAGEFGVWICDLVICYTVYVSEPVQIQDEPTEHGNHETK